MNAHDSKAGGDAERYRSCGQGTLCLCREILAILVSIEDLDPLITMQLDLDPLITIRGG